MVQDRSDKKNIFWLSLGSGRSYYHLSTFSNLSQYDLSLLVVLQMHLSSKLFIRISLTPSDTQLVPKPKSAARGKGAPTPDELVNILGVYSDKRPRYLSSTHLRRKISPDLLLLALKGATSS